jgi:hypothetical protein
MMGQRHCGRNVRGLMGGQVHDGRTGGMMGGQGYDGKTALRKCIYAYFRP